MNLVRYNTNRDDYTSRAFDGFFNRFLNNQAMTTGTSEVKFMPNADVFENDNEFELELALPGVKKEDVELSIADNLLIISGERKIGKEREEGKYYSYETNYGAFKRSFKLPKNVNQTKVEASYENGILSITLPKIDENKLKTTVKIK